MSALGTVELDKAFVISLLECLKSLCTTEDAFALESFKKQGLALVASGNVRANLTEIRGDLRFKLVEKAVEKWNSDASRIEGWMEIIKLELAEGKEFVEFKWTQIVWQEILMWCGMAVEAGKITEENEVTVGPITKCDFDFICERRGFDRFQIAYLLEILDHIGIEIAKEPNSGILTTDETSPRPEMGEVVETVESEESRLQRVASEYGMEYYKFDDKGLPPYVLAAIPGKIARLYGIMPVTLYKGTLTVAMWDPSDLEALDSLRYILKLDVEGVVASKEEIEKALDHYYPKNEVSDFNVNGMMVGETEEGFGPDVVE